MKSPFEIHIKRASRITAGRAWSVRGIALIAAFVLISILLLCMGYAPFEVIASVFYGAFGKELFIQELMKQTIPLLVTALGISIAFKMKVWNIGGEGQILVGGIAATFISLCFAGKMPQPILLLCMALAAFVVAGIYGMIPGICKAKWNTNETLLTLMFNYIALRMITLIANQPFWQNPNDSYPKVRMLDFSSRLPKVFGVHIGWIFAIFILVFYILYTKKTKSGFELMVVGDSVDTARYAGIHVKKVVIKNMFLSAAICGIAGFMQVAGADGTLSEATAGGMGFTAITVAWLAGMNPYGMVVTSLLIATLERGSSQIQTRFLIPESFANVMIGIILLFMMGCEFFIKYRVVIGRKGQEYDS